MIPPEDLLYQILNAGIQAPSAENIHYFWLEVGEQTVTLHATGHASWANRPDSKMLALMSYGAVVENITLRAQALGFKTHETWRFDSSRVVELSWQPATQKLDLLERAISTRHTNRRFYQRAPIASDVLEQVSAAANAVAGARVHWLTSGPQRRLALSLIRMAETERFRRKGLHQEMFGSIRFEQGWDRTVLEGLAPAALQVEAPMRWPFAWLRHWRLMRAVNILGSHFALGLRSGYMPCALAPHMGLLMLNDANEDAAQVKAGRALQRVWLATEQDSLAFQPMAAATVLLRQISAPDWVSANMQNRLDKRLQALCAELDVNDPAARPYMFFRLGRAPAPTAVAGRRALQYFLKPPP